MDPMSRSGPDTLDSDYACDYLYLEVMAPLIEQLQIIVDDPSAAEPDDSISEKVMVAVDVLSLLIEHLGALPPKLELVEQCAEAYLRVWDGYIEELHPTWSTDAEWEEYKQARRAVILRSFERLLALTRKGWEGMSSD
jgi:hypothetical protein